MKRIVLSGATILTGAVLLSGCGGLTSVDTESSEPALEAPSGVQVPDSAQVPGEVLGNSGKQAPADSSTRTYPNAVAQTAEQDRLIVRTASMVVVVDEPEQELATASQIAAEAGGSVTSTRTGSGSCDRPVPMSEYEDQIFPPCYPGSGVDITTMTLRVPVATFDDTVRKLGEIGEVAQLSSDSSDVTESVVDVEARIKTQRASVKRVRALLSQASTIDEIVTIEQELTSRQAELESLLARQKSLKGAAAMSTITVQFTTDAGTVVVIQEGWFDDVIEAFGAAWKGLVVGVAFLSPLILLVLGLGVVLIVFLRRRRGSSEPESAPQPTVDDQS